MEKSNLVFNLKGPLWSLISDVNPEDYLEPMDPISFTEIPLGPMSDVAKATFTVREQLFGALLVLLDLQDTSEDDINDFDTWLVDASREDCITKYKSLGETKIIAVLQVRNQYLFACQFLDLVVAQQYELDPDDMCIFYREGFIVAIQKAKLFEDPLGN